ncbi:hypothetical protein [Pyxidicoccus xibeiensis]|uniref:hypothetical protein n=1 Tax=Pyxidicoccus xibeiensis TaxID=2906759 RepID=UPI0020A7795F|nr:hypothetical protein [Pyxidicoccus xibeiensis]MCP3139384.1 hypothetical protein [Pyxidicoccus xibeiensis]
MLKRDAGRVLLTGILLSFGGAESQAAGGDCPTSPQSYDTESCQGFCVRDAVSKTMRCDITASPGDNDVVVVKNYKDAIPIFHARYSAWGTADGVNFCCTQDSSPANPLNGVEVLTGAGSDEVWFTAFNGSGNERNLSDNPFQTAPDWFTGTARPGAGNDRVYGSNSTSVEYMDHLTGEDGSDQLTGNKGADFINVAETRAGVDSTGNHLESASGGNGRDEIVGATSDINATDTIIVSGGAQDDLLCTGSANALTGQNVRFSGGEGDDEIYSMSSRIAGNDGPLNGDAGSDGCDNPGGGVETSCSRSYNGSNFTAWSPLACPP